MIRSLAFLAVLVAVGWSTRGALDVAFLQDDFHVTQVLGPEMRLDAETTWRLVHPPADERDARLRPVPYVSLLFDIHWFGIDPRLLHLAGWLLHLIATALVFVLVGAVWPGRPAVGWLAALVFGIHGAHVDAIGWLAARADPWVGVATLATALAYARFRASGSVVAATVGVACALGALGSKEAGVVTIALVALVEAGFRIRGAAAPMSRVLGAFAMLAVVTGGYFLYRRHLFGVFLGSYGNEDAATLRIGTDAIGVFARNLLAPYGELVREAIVPAVVLLGAAILGRDRSPRRWAIAAVLVAGIAIAVAPVVPFLDRTHGRHYYVAVVPWAILLAAAIRAWWTRHAALGALALTAVVATSFVGLQAKMSDYIEAGAITQAVRRDLAAIRDEHPAIGIVAVGGLVPSWQRAPLFFAGFDFLARPPFTDPPVPVASYRATDRRDRRWEAYVERRKPMLFCELVATDASGRPGLERRSPLIADLPPRAPSPAYTTNAPAPGARIAADSTLAFEFTVPVEPWPRPLRLVIHSQAGTFPLLLRERHVRTIGVEGTGRRVRWQASLGVDGDDALAARIAALVTEPVSIRWWVEEADLDLDGVRATPSSADAHALLVPSR